jgi:protein-S-isoprenylcysteine O-methyltransferase Ste14
MVLMPGIVAGYVPWRYFGLREARWDRLGPVQIVGLAGLIAGVLLLVACVWEFARSGRGTLSPVDPPRELVVQGLYRYVRNPMYLAVSLILLGEALAIGSRGLFLYWAVFFILANGFVILYEEPNLRRRFGASYDRYLISVGRWIPRLPGRGASPP